MLRDRSAARRAALLDLLRPDGLDGLIVTHLPNIRYLTGFTGTAGVAVVMPNETLFVSDFRYRDQANEEIGAGVRVEIVPQDVWGRLWQMLRAQRTVERLGFEAHVTSVADAQRMTDAGLRSRLEPVKGLVERLRVCKDADEVAAIREAARLAQGVLEAALSAVAVGQREIDVAARLEQELRCRGSEWHPFRTIVASGVRSALPHARTSTRHIAVGELLLLDFGAEVEGYCADVTRTVVVGRHADERQRTVYELVREAQRVARTRIRAGMTGREADALARGVIEARGFGDAFGHSLGHGLGLEVHEEPRVSRANEQPLPVGAVITVEPGVYLPGWGGVRIEDDVHLGPDGPELLTTGDTELREIV